MEKMLIFRVNLTHVIPEIYFLRKMNPVLRVSTDIYGVSKEIDRKTLIFQINLGM